MANLDLLDDLHDAAEQNQALRNALRPAFGDIENIFELQRLDKHNPQPQNLARFADNAEAILANIPEEHHAAITAMQEHVEDFKAKVNTQNPKNFDAYLDSGRKANATADAIALTTENRLLNDALGKDHPNEWNATKNALYALKEAPNSKHAQEQAAQAIAGLQKAAGSQVADLTGELANTLAPAFPDAPFQLAATQAANMDINPQNITPEGHVNHSSIEMGKSEEMLARIERAHLFQGESGIASSVQASISQAFEEHAVMGEPITVKQMGQIEAAAQKNLQAIYPNASDFEYAQGMMKDTFANAGKSYLNDFKTHLQNSDIPNADIFLKATDTLDPTQSLSQTGRQMASIANAAHATGGKASLEAAQSVIKTAVEKGIDNVPVTANHSAHIASEGFGRRATRLLTKAGRYAPGIGIAFAAAGNAAMASEAQDLYEAGEITQEVRDAALAGYAASTANSFNPEIASSLTIEEGIGQMQKEAGVPEHLRVGFASGDSIDTYQVDYAKMERIMDSLPKEQSAHYDPDINHMIAMRDKVFTAHEFADQAALKMTTQQNIGSVMEDRGAGERAEIAFMQAHDKAMEQNPAYKQGMETLANGGTIQPPQPAGLKGMSPEALAAAATIGGQMNGELSEANGEQVASGHTPAQQAAIDQAAQRG